MKFALLLLAGVSVAYAGCPNACSGHGSCGTHDECDCFNNYGGNDCSQRICPYFTSWVTTPQGDMNRDGDIVDGTVTSTTNIAANHPTYFNHEIQGLFAFESWPMSKSTNGVDEGHYNMECANQGLCDRKSGECSCFAGYEGVACRRSSCPNDCSGNGVCRTVSQIGFSLSSYTEVTYATNGAISRSSQNGALNYKFWDKDMSQACVCDSGYSGADCAERQCPLGDDPLTTGQHDETQWVDVYAEKQFTGQISFTYTDLYGESWETQSFTTKHYEGVDGSLSADAENALRALPDQMLSGVTVSVNYCEKPVAGYHKGTYATVGAVTTLTLAAATNTKQGPFSSDSNDPTTPTDGLCRFSGTDVVCDLGDSGDCLPGYLGATTDADDALLYEVENRYCIRYTVTFNGRSGDIPDLKVNTDGIVVPSGVNELENAADGATAGSISQSDTTVTVTVGTSQVNGGTGTRFSVYDLIHVECDGASYGIQSVVSASGTALTYSATAGTVSDCTEKITKVQRVVAHSSLNAFNGVGSSSTDSPDLASSITIDVTAGNSAAHTCTEGSITSSVFTCTSATTGFDAKVHYNEKVQVECGSMNYGTYTVDSSAADGMEFIENVPDCPADSEIKITLKDWVVKTDVDVVAVEADGHIVTGLTLSFNSETCDVSELIADSSSATAGTRFKCGNSASASWSAVADHDSCAYQGAGTTESAPCADRGVCDLGTGQCECFKGYSSSDCHTQSALSA